ncbi:MAG: sigma-54 dependent transcriptional regulator [Magnetococcus sp. WYHC-3]
MNSLDRLLPGKCPEMMALKRAADLVSATDATVLILGESGSGKERLAQALHQRGPRREQPFVALAGSTLADHPRRLLDAHGGTLFLDEVADLPMSIQPRLLRFLECGEFHPPGADAPVRLNARVIAASRHDLVAEVAQGRLRGELFYRLNVVPLTLPPLRQRDGDIDLLTDRFLAELAAHYQQPLPRLTGKAREVLRKHPWPGNLRELRNMCERLVILQAGRPVGPENLPTDVTNAPRTPPGVASLPFALPEGGLDWDEMERSLILQALERCQGNRSRAARFLGLTRDTLLYRIGKHALG